MNETVTKPAATLDDVLVEFEIQGERRVALDHVGLEVRPGELLVLVGRSGCGKTTILNALSGLVSPTSGRVEVLGDRLPAARRHIAYMFARDALLPWRTARRNVEFALELRRPQIGRSERRQAAQELLDQVRIGNSAGLFPWQLSQGMRQRVALARTWAIQPQLLLMDEPFAALDAQTRIAMHERFLETWADNRCSIVFVTHDLTEAILLADRVLTMAEGRVIDEVDVDIPRPRDPELAQDDERFRDIHRRLALGLHEENRAPGGNTLSTPKDTPPTPKGTEHT